MQPNETSEEPGDLDSALQDDLDDTPVARHPDDLDDGDDGEDGDASPPRRIAGGTIE